MTEAELTVDPPPATHDDQSLHSIGGTKPSDDMTGTIKLRSHQITSTATPPPSIVTSHQTGLLASYPPQKTQPMHFFDFLGLPRELRDEIYQYLLPKRLYDRKSTLYRYKNSGLLYVNKQVTFEFLDTIYKNAIYTLHLEPCGGSCPCKREEIPTENSPMSLFMAEVAVHCPPYHVTLAPKHICSLQNFRRIDVIWNLEYEKRAKGTSNLRAIAHAVGAAARDGVKLHPTVELTLIWKYGDNNEVTAKSGKLHRKRVSRWAGFIRTAGLKVKVLKEDVTYWPPIYIHHKNRYHLSSKAELSCK